MEAPKLVGIIILLVIFNSIFLYKNVSQNHEINVQELKKDQVLDKNFTPNNYKFKFKKSNTALFLLVFFTDKGCEACVENEVQNLNRIANKYKAYLHVYVLGKNKISLKRYGPNFTFKNIPSRINIFSNPLSFRNPLAILIDSNGLIQAIHKAKVGNPADSKRFYQRMASLFASLP